MQTFDGAIVAAGHDVLSWRVEVCAAHGALVPAEDQHLARGERLQVSRWRQLGHQVQRIYR